MALEVQAVHLAVVVAQVPVVHPVVVVAQVQVVAVDLPDQVVQVE